MIPGSINKILVIKFVVILIIPAMLGAGLFYNFLYNRMKNELVNRNYLLTESLAGEVERIMSEPLMILSHVSGNITSNIVKDKDINRYLQSVISDYKYFESLLIVNQNGKIGKAAPYNVDLIGNTILTREFRNFINLGDRKNIIYISPTFASYQTNYTTIALSMIMDSKTVIGYMNLKSLESVIGRVSLEGGVAFITDINGIVIAHPEDRYVNERISFNNMAIVNKALKGNDGVYYYRHEGKDYVGCAFKIVNKSMLLVITQPEDQIFGSLLKIKYYSISGMFVIILVSFLIGKSTINRTLEPLQMLKGVTRKVAMGDYNIDMTGSRYAEIQDIWNNFKEMANAVRDREDDLQKTRNYLTSLFNSQSSILISVNEEMKIEQFNNTAGKYADEKGISLNSEFLWDIFPFLTPYRSEIMDLMEGRSTTYSCDIKTGDHIHEFIQVWCYSATSENIKRILIRMDDITEAKNREQMLQQIQKMETVGTLAGGLAHDFNNVLGGIIGTVSILEYKIEQYGTVEPEMLKHYIKIMRESGERATKIIQQLLTLSRKHESVFEYTDLNSIIKNVMVICETTIDKSVTLDPQYSGTPAVVKADREQMEQVILNLCVNAAHAMTIMRKDEKWGGQLSIILDKITTDKFLTIYGTDESETGYWRLSVADTGVGIKKEILDRIFDPFFTTKESGEGTGLGLSMVYNIIRKHNGFVKVYSEEGAGSIFHLYLPVSGEGLDLTDFTVSELFIKRGEGHVLVIDDEQVMRNIVKDMLEECGYSVTVCKGGPEGLEYFAANKNTIRAVFLDLSMPVMSGKEVYYKLLEIDPDVKVLLASGFRQDARVEELLSAGIKGFIQKPPTLQKLSVEIHRIIYR